MGLSVQDMDEMTIGLILDMLIETTYDQDGYIRRANQADYDAF